MAELAVLGAALGTAAAEAATIGTTAAIAAAPAATAGTTGLGTALTAATTAASLAGTGLTAFGAMRQGENQRAIGEFNATELERAAQEERGAAARKAQERRLQTERVISEQRAKASMSGAGTVQGEGYLDLIGDVGERGQYFSELDIYQGEERARGREGQATAARWSGENAERAGYVNAAGAGIKGFQAAMNDDDLLGYVGVKRERRGRYYS